MPRKAPPKDSANLFTSVPVADASPSAATSSSVPTASLPPQTSATATLGPNAASVAPHSLNWIHASHGCSGTGWSASRW